jgi:hypothetical protein
MTKLLSANFVGFLALFAVKGFNRQRTLEKRQDRGEKEDLSSRSRQPRFAERLDDRSQALKFRLTWLRIYGVRFEPKYGAGS